MKFAEADSGTGHLIQDYEPGWIRIDGRSYRQGLILSPQRILTGWGPKSAAELSAEHFAALVQFDPQILLVGTGKRQLFPDPQTYLQRLPPGLGIEFMDTPAACRTYNILMAEDRKVVAGLMIV